MDNLYTRIHFGSHFVGGFDMPNMIYESTNLHDMLTCTANVACLCGLSVRH